MSIGIVYAIAIIVPTLQAYEVGIVLASLANRNRNANDSHSADFDTI